MLSREFDDWKAPAATLACCLVSVAIGVFAVTQMPASDPPSQGPALRAAVVFWLVAMVAIVVGCFVVAPRGTVAAALVAALVLAASAERGSPRPHA